MAIKIAINGYGRIGRNILRILYENKYSKDIEIVAINDLCDSRIKAHLTQYDTIHGKFFKKVKSVNDNIFIDKKKIITFSEKDPSKLPWKDLQIDVVCECTGKFIKKELAYKHIDAGAKKVLISSPSDDADITVVYGVNHSKIKSTDVIISNSSCTTNCLAPLAKILDNEIGILSGIVTTIHSYTNDQVLIDSIHSDLRRARSATQSIIPTKTGALNGINLVLPNLANKIDGLALRVPIPNVSIIDFVFSSIKKTNVKKLNLIMKRYASDNMKGILGYNDNLLVSSDFNHNCLSTIFDATQTKVIGNLVKVMAWYDNEWGFATRMLDVIKILCS